MKKFTLIELLMVIAIIGILTSILIPSLTKAREMSRSTVCMSQLDQLGITMFSRDSDKFIDHVLRLGDGREIPWSRKRAFPGDNSILRCPSDPKSDPRRRNPSYGYNWVHLNVQPMAKVTNPAETIFFAESDSKYETDHPWKDRTRVKMHIANGAVKEGRSSFAPIGVRHYNGGNILWVDGHVSRLSGDSNIINIHLTTECWDLE